MMAVNYAPSQPFLAPKLENFGLKICPRGFEARRTWGFEAQQHGVSRGGGGVSRHSNMGFRGAATWDLEAQQH